MISSKLLARYAADPAAFRADLRVDVDGSVKRLGDVMDQWQRDDFAAIDPALMRCNGRSTTDARMRAWLERARGHSKTTDIAVVCVWALAFSTRPIRAFAYAADRDQAALLKAAMHTLIRLNPWLGEILAVEQHKVVVTESQHPGHGGTLTIEASDVASSWGILPDLVVADEICHWPDKAADLWHSLISSAAKRTNCLLLAITNSGFVDSWQWGLREAIRTDDEAWYFSRLDGVKASWMNDKRLEEQRRQLPPVAFARLWLNEWSTGGGDALTKEDIAAAFANEWRPMSGKERGYIYVAGLDLGLTRDCSSVVVLATEANKGTGRIKLAHHKLWKPVRGQKMNLLEVERYIRELDAKFNLEYVGFDPWQAEHLAQRLEADRSHYRRNAKRLRPEGDDGTVQPWMRAIQQTGKNLQAIATLVLESFNDKRLQLFECEPLRRDLLRLRVEERPTYGFRLTSPRDGDGHGDSFSAFSYALLLAHEVAGKFQREVGVINHGADDYAPASISEWQERQREYADEMSRLHQGGYDDTTARDPLRQINRFNSFGFTDT